MFIDGAISRNIVDDIILLIKFVNYMNLSNVKYCNSRNLKDCFSSFDSV